jgi:hypothetical protein
MASAKNSHDAGPLGGQPGPWKLEIRNWKCGPRQSAIYTPAKVREDGRKKKNLRTKPPSY